MAIDPNDYKAMNKLMREICAAINIKTFRGDFIKSKFVTTLLSGFVKTRFGILLITVKPIYEGNLVSFLPEITKNKMMSHVADRIIETVYEVTFKLRIMHNGLKPENFLINVNKEDGTYHIALADFKFAHIYDRHRIIKLEKADLLEIV